ncbi:MAG: pseudaminic acid cytidylyltransferase [Pseudomonas palmensis]|uniref:pseudaminic acid cytidylyltransferase n=1 Tax=Pseudomonas palmensis TaxID=2815362 RepID=UPI003D098D64
MRLAVIPARGGSKRIPNKNIKEFCGKPMISWAISTAMESGCFDKIIVSTDDSRIADLSRSYGADVPFVRPAALADDYTGTIPVIRHAIEECRAQGYEATFVCCIYATAPFITAADLREGLQLIQETNSPYVFSITSFPFPIQRALRLSGEGQVEMFNPEHVDTRSQDLEEAYHDAGQFYWGRTEAWEQEQAIFSTKSAAVVLPRHRVQDIDTLEDWTRAEWLFKALRAESGQ